jgi:alpha-L-arabinofuranosidase
LYKTPTYYAQQLYATLAGNQPLSIESKVPQRAPPDVSATLSDDGTVVTLFAVNATLEDVVRPVDYSPWGELEDEVATWTLTDRKHAGEPDATNSFGEPERISPVARTYKAGGTKFEYRFPALSLTVLKRIVKSKLRS